MGVWTTIGVVATTVIGPKSYFPGKRAKKKKKNLEPKSQALSYLLPLSRQEKSNLLKGFSWCFWVRVCASSAELEYEMPWLQHLPFSRARSTVHASLCVLLFPTYNKARIKSMTRGGKLTNIFSLFIARSVSSACVLCAHVPRVTRLPPFFWGLK